MKETNFKTIRLSLETIDDARLKGTGGKVSTEDIRRAVFLLKEQGFTKNEIGVYLMYGLPGQNLDEVMEGIEFLKSLKININLTEYSPVKGTRSWDELASRGVIDERLDPLLINNTVFSFLYSGYNNVQLSDIKSDVKKYNARIE
jgi:molybdenum cofactor biosynthesis enzyme MoaA